MQLIAAVDRQWGIGFRGALLTRIRADMKHFRTVTGGKTVILGSRTLATFPGGKALPNRRNIVLSRRADFAPEGAEVAHSVEEVLALLGDTASEDVWVIGGDSVYRQFLPYCTGAEITELDRTFQADATLPSLADDPAWERVTTGAWQSTDPATDEAVDLRFRFVTYKRIRP